MPAAQETLLVAPCRMRLGRRIIRLSIQCRKQKTQRLFAVLWRIGIGVWQGTKVKIIGIEAVWALATCPVDLSAAEAGLDGSNHACSNLVLEIENALHAAIEAIGP